MFIGVTKFQVTFQEIIQLNQLLLIVVEMEKEEILKWID